MPSARETIATNVTNGVLASVRNAYLKTPIDPSPVVDRFA
jgi:hypothetical protein